MTPVRPDASREAADEADETDDADEVNEADQVNDADGADQVDEVDEVDEADVDADYRVLNLVTNGEARFYLKQVEALERAGVDCTTLAVPGDHAEDDARSPADYLRLLARFRRRDLSSYDLVHANYGLTAPIALGQRRLPVVVSLWGSDLYGRYGWIGRYCARHCDAVVVMSEPMARDLDVDSEVVPHGVDFETFAPMPRAEARAELGWDPDAHHVLFPYGTDRHVKNFPRARRVVDAAAERVDAPVELQTITGVPHDRMVYYHNAADLLLLTSRREGSPNTVKEALACNVPVVATDVGDVADRLAGVSPSFVCRDDDCLVDGVVSVLEGGGRSNGREAASDLRLATMRDRYLEVYRDVTDVARVRA